ncbi:Gfo/Idh/MocA family protein [Paenibacillus humicola]|uniref:Gfo/Idh/MocA family protein n=1 Tax=Paenibacillus humicola TaxID=3110540 RepID=UPI00237AA02D|nr:Gfo/Idh/MocA family oxidoreductase [Paenibacillus humicola]
MKNTTSGKIRIAFVGAGKMANMVHYPSLASFDDVEIAAICDYNEQALRTTAEKYGISKRYNDYKKMIDEVAPDAVYAIGQPHLMYDVWMWCLEQGQNLYIEKPFGITIHQARSLAYMAEKNGNTTQVSFQRRSSPMIDFLRNECLKRGPIVHSVCRFYKSNIAPRLDAVDHMMDDTVHSIDTIRWMNSGEVIGIESMTKRVLVPNINFISAALHFDNGSSGYLMNSWSSGRRIFAVEMHAPHICAEAELEGKGYLYADGDTKGTEYDARILAQSDELYAYAGFRSKNREFIDAIKKGTQPSSHFGEALKTMEVAEKILAQAVLAGR